jgi:hypothetical protein
MYAQLLRPRLQLAAIGAVLENHEQLMPFGWVQTLVERNSKIATSLLSSWTGIE